MKTEDGILKNMLFAAVGVTLIVVATIGFFGTFKDVVFPAIIASIGALLLYFSK